MATTTCWDFMSELRAGFFAQFGLQNDFSYREIKV